MTIAGHRTPLVVGIGGSTSVNSVTSLLLRAALELVAERGARTLEFSAELLARLPVYSASAAVADPAASELVNAVRAADAVIISSPGYHGAMSGLVKNAVDHLEALRDDDRPYLDGRAVGIVVAASGWQACGTTLVSVRSTVHSLRGWPTPFAVMVNSAEQQPSVEGRFDGRIVGALQILAGQVVDFTSWQAAARAPVG